MCIASYENSVYICGIYITTVGVVVGVITYRLLPACVPQRQTSSKFQPNYKSVTMAVSFTLTETGQNRNMVEGVNNIGAYSINSTRSGLASCTCLYTRVGMPGT